MQIAIHGILWFANIAFYFFVGVLYWIGGTTAMIAVFVGIPIAVLVTVLLVYWWLVPTSEQRREYLRDKRRKLRAAKEQSV
ncbi:hypothetical protein LOC67_24645 [Stieleria sp. JC731]|uniref:hypothetical protein n=1 Tax=Pirellulaceae TaxID=2691357 RepID=UPI001E2A4DB9|nr:hypothetical protein [Stieleria sp. JC731]MCC9603752.1 hypothetical protein [Stieleria sp. JC731]